MENEKGFTLIEVLASLVIISIVLMSFMAIFSNTNALAVSNSEKLVVINLADAYLERVKVDPKGTINLKNEENAEDTDESITFPPPLSAAECKQESNNSKGGKEKKNKKKECFNKLLTDYAALNGKDYHVLFKFSQEDHDNGKNDYSEKDLSLLNVIVTVTSVESNISSSVEGYVPYEEADNTDKK